MTDIMSQAMIVDMILEEMVVHLRTVMVDAIDEDDPSRVDVVKKGLIIENKTTENIQLGVQGGDHADPDIEDGILTLQKIPEIFMQYAPREIGGGQVWVRRGIVKLDAYFTIAKLKEDDAFTVAYNILGRLTQAIDGTPVSGMKDDYGEKAITIHAYSSKYHESGGPPASYIFRGQVNWLCFTERP